MSRNEVIQIALSVMDCQPDQVTELLGIEPTSKYLRGTTRSDPPQPKRNAWHFKTHTATSGSELGAHVDSFRKNFEGKQNAVRELSHSNEVSLTIIFHEIPRYILINQWFLKFALEANLNIELVIYE